MPPQDFLTAEDGWNKLAASEFNATASIRLHGTLISARFEAVKDNALIC